MAIIVILALISLTGLFFVYRVIAMDAGQTVSASSVQIPKSHPRVKKRSFSFLSFNFLNNFILSFRKPEPRVVPIRSLKEYFAAQREGDLSGEMDLTREKMSAQAGDSAAAAAVVFKASADPYNELKARYDELKDSHRRLEKLLSERTARLEQVELSLNAQLALHQDFDKVKSWLDEQIRDLRLELADKSRLIEILQNPPVNRIISQDSDRSAEFLRLPADLIPQSRSDLSENSLREGQAKFHVDPESVETHVFYRMPSEADIIRNLKSKKYSV